VFSLLRRREMKNEGAINSRRYLFFNHRIRSKATAQSRQ
jgi:hypothetical protein